jgi:hypothetical protein
MDRNELLVEPCHLGVQLGVSKTISEPMVRSAQIVHLSCTNTNISKQTKTRFQMTHVTYDFWAYDKFGANRAPILHRQ